MEDKMYKSMYYAWDKERETWRVVRTDINKTRDTTPFGFDNKYSAQRYIKAFGLKPREGKPI
jgi:hypothetical protein